MPDIEAAIKTILNDVEDYPTYMLYTVPEDVDPPMITFVVNEIEDPAPLLNGTASGMFRAGVDVRVYAPTTDERNTMADAVIAAMEADNRVVGNVSILAITPGTRRKDNGLLDEGSETLTFVETIEYEVFYK